MGLVHNYPGLLAGRWFLGVAEVSYPHIQYMLPSRAMRANEVSSRLVSSPQLHIC